MVTLRGVSVALLEERAIVREFMVWLLGQQGLSVAATGGSVESFCQALIGGIDLALIHVPDTLPETPGWLERTVLEVRRRFPELPVVVMGEENDPELASACTRHGVTLLGKWSTSTEALMRALGEVLGMAPAAGGPPPPELARLTAREREVLAHVGAGHDNLKISALLGVTEHTVKAHMVAIYRKIQVENRVELALLARRAGLRVSEARARPAEARAPAPVLALAAAR